VFRNAYDIYIKDANKEKLIPIIMFTDKTHTDMHGRLCLEPVQFTLGIFKRDVRNQPRAWRTLGYVTDLKYTGKFKTKAKMQDYHLILGVILESFIKCQIKPLVWHFMDKDSQQMKPMAMKIPVLYVIGDTDGHDKLCGKYGCRNNTVKRLCRYCDTPFEETSSSDFKYSLNKLSQVKALIEKHDEATLNDMSFHCIENVWHQVQFCDPVRNIYGATLAEVLHCMQQGIFEYAIKILFEQKKKKKKRKRKYDNDTDSEASNIESEDDDDDSQSNYRPMTKSELSTRKVFSDAYRSRFESLCKKYGKILSHQSDRNLPRTYFNTEYTTITRKNGHEMAGLIIVFLLVMLSDEGTNSLDTQLGADRCSAYIHTLELLLQLENFCKLKEHTVKNLKTMKKGMPYIMDELKQVLNRQQGCGMNFVKFHLMRHYVEDIVRFGSMCNYDSAIGERNHMTEVKDPARHTQRRKHCFEKQTAKRYVENITILRACSDINNIEFKTSLNSNTIDTNLSNKTINRRCNIEYIHEQNSFFKKNYETKKFDPCTWKDCVFVKQLQELCNVLVENDHIEYSDINFFTQHNREDLIFRADPCYDDGNPWYDWAYINWGGQDLIPAKILIFMDLTSNFKKPFGSHITGYINHKSCYGIGYSFQNLLHERAHGISNLVQYGKLMTENKRSSSPQLCFFPVDSIATPCIAVPYKADDTVINALEWLVLKPRDEWHSILINLLKTCINKD
jgi:hypothetical protein